MRSLNKPSAHEIMGAAVDVASPQLGVQISFTEERDKLWVNIDGICILRVQGIKPGTLEIEMPNTGEENG